MVVHVGYAMAGLLVVAASCTDARPAPPAAAEHAVEVVAGDEATPRAPPAVLRFIPVDRDAALVVVANGDERSLTRIGSDGAPQWVQRLGKVRTDWSQVFAIDGDQAIIWGDNIEIRALADGSLRRSIAEVPAWVSGRPEGARRPFHMSPSAIDGRIFAPISDDQHTWITAFDATRGAELWRLERPEQTNVEPLTSSFVRLNLGSLQPIPTRADVEGAGLSPAGLPRTVLEVVHAATGEVAWRTAYVDTCLTDGWLVVSTPEDPLAVWDTGRAAPRSPIPAIQWPRAAPSLAARTLKHCHRIDDKLWAVFESSALEPDPPTIVILEPGASDLRPHFSLTGDVSYEPGKWLMMHGDEYAKGVGLFDLEAGRFAWVQDFALDRVAYRYMRSSGDTVYLETSSDKGTYHLALDRTSGAALAAVKITGASLYSISDGRLWFAGPAQTPGVPIALAVLDARTLRPVAPPGVGITVTDRSEAARAAWRPAGADAGAAWALKDLTAAAPR